MGISKANFRDARSNTSEDKKREIFREIKELGVKKVSNIPIIGFVWFYIFIVERKKDKINSWGLIIYTYLSEEGCMKIYNECYSECCVITFI